METMSEQASDKGKHDGADAGVADAASHAGSGADRGAGSGVTDGAADSAAPDHGALNLGLDMPDDNGPKSAKPVSQPPVPSGTAPLASPSGASPEMTQAPENKTEKPFLDAPVEQDSAQPYRVLARKYRPQTFSGLIGQSAMVQTLSNAIKRQRLAHAFLMTGVRGVGKTSTARLIAKALNCIGPDGNGGPTIDPCGRCEPCTAIAEGRHIDVIEMDAASHTGVDDVREIIEAVRYASVSARYKIYIIDEVHMLSKNAFNALLKTLEEPPAHVKFLFATTEVDKVPITVLSRCQRFDLKRIETEMLITHFADICDKEAVDADHDALVMIARAADGSVRDGLSVLDQAIAHADMALEEGADSNARPHISAGAVRSMLGLSDRTVVRQLLSHVLHGEDKAMLALLGQQHELGVEPLAQVRALMDMVHATTLAKIDDAAARNTGLSDEQQALNAFAGQMSHGTLHRLWQMLLKAHGEVGQAPDPREAMDMAMLRLVFAASLPDPGAVARAINNGMGAGQNTAADQNTGSGQNTGASASPAISPAPSAQPAGSVSGGEAATEIPQSTAPTIEPHISSHQEPGAASASALADSEMSDAVMPDMAFGDVIQALERHGDLRLAQVLHDQMRLIDYAPGRIIYQLARDAGPSFDAEMRDALLRITGQRWKVERGQGEAQPSIRERAQAERQAREASIMETPLVKAALASFPDAKLTKYDAATGDENARTNRSLRA